MQYSSAPPSRVQVIEAPDEPGSQRRVRQPICGPRRWFL